MSAVLYDVPGPRARRRSTIGTVVALIVLGGLVALAALRLVERGQFDTDLWAPWIDPGTEEFPLVWGLVRDGLVATLTAAVLAIAFSLVVGVALGTARMMLGRAGRVPVVGLVELLRGLPVIITIVIVWRFFEELDLDISALPGEDGLWYVVIGLTLYNSVIIAEILRAGVASLPRGQGEAAMALGMTRWQVMRTVLLPQAFRVMLPALVSQLVVILKDTSLAALLGLYSELLDRGNQIAQNLDNPIQTLFVIGAIFILINYALSRVAVRLEKRLSRGNVDSAAVRAAEEAVPVG